MKSKSQVKIEDILRKANLKITISRMEILSFLMKTKKPVIVEDVQVGINNAVNLTTTYRTLEQFVQKNIVCQTDFRDGKVYYEYQTHHHHHIVCTICGDTEEVAVCIEEQIPVLVKSSKKFVSVDDHVLEFFGTCTTCTTS
jgi:Fe2+ or Zn2+ uptake regulation protein